MFLNLVPKFDDTHGSCIELAVWCGVEQMRDHETGKMAMHQWHSIEHIRRQGQALCLELTSNAPKSNIEHFRMATRESRIRCLLRIMISVNNWLKSGHWRGKPFSPENYADDAAQNTYNRAAMHAATTKLTQILSYGVYAQALKGPCITIPISSTHVSTECRQCGKQFETASLLKRTKITFGCSGCDVVLCTDCVDNAVKRTRVVCEVEEGVVFPVTPIMVTAASDIWWCNRCIKTHTRAQKGLKHQNTDTDREQEGDTKPSSRPDTPPTPPNKRASKK